MHPCLEAYIGHASLGFDGIPRERQAALRDLAGFVSAKLTAGEAAELVFICTHNSRRSQMAQIWAVAAAAWFGVEGVGAHSGGTEVTAFNPCAVTAMRKAGFTIDCAGGDNPRYRVTYDEGGPAFECFSKTYDDPSNPEEGFAAVMTCSDADEACPVPLGSAFRAPIRYGDPKVADATPGEAAAYDQRCLQIATEILYLFSQIA